MTTAKEASGKTDQAFDAARDYADKMAQQAKDAYARFKVASDEAAGALGTAFEKGSKECKEFGRASVEISRSNLNAHFDFLNALIGTKSVGQAVELQNAFVREQFGVYAQQAKELSALAQKAVAEGSRPVQDMANRTFKSAQAL